MDPIDLSLYRHAIFDCDGVILDSNGVKTNAFAKALEGEPDELVEQFVGYHRANGGVSRYEKFKYYFTNLKQIDDFQGPYECLLERYQAICKRDLALCVRVPGIERILMACQSRSILCVVNSGGEEAEVNEVLGAHELGDYFEHIYGSPRNKVENMERIYSGLVNEGRGVYFGDARSDMLAAEQFGLDFVLISGVSEWVGGADEAEERGHVKASDFNELLGATFST